MVLQYWIAPTDTDRKSRVKFKNTATFTINPMSYTFRFAKKSIFGYMRFVIYFGLQLGITLALLAFIYQGRGSGQLSPFVYFVFIALGFLVLILAIGFLSLLFIPAAQQRYGYLKISPQGFEYQRWPFYRLQGGWDEVEKVEKGTVNLPPNVVMRLMGGGKSIAYASLLIRKRIPGREIRFTNTTIGSARFHVIALNELDGWDDGSLETALKFYAPHAFS